GNLIARPSAARTTVLAVDDDPQVLDVLEVILRQHGVAVTGIVDPLGFWDALERTAPDALILDEDMPHLTGIELCRVVRADPRRACSSSWGSRSDATSPCASPCWTSTTSRT